ncbi:MAG: hypothetical protein IPJ41_05725 [Phycisphaerales bacterium]|nr:hypothetical protein [Phycisphaerales bacterium]
MLRAAGADRPGRAAWAAMAAWAVALGGCSRAREDPPSDGVARAPAAYVGRSGCAECHERESSRWQGSHHDMAMDVATPETVLGDFDDARLEHFGVTSRMYRSGGRPMVETDGPDGALHEYEVKYVFGVFPLQQYLVEFPGGRLQTLPLCWDARPAGEGGQRWFHIYPDEPIPAGDELHWTGVNQNWNHMCAECHSTNLRKGYDATNSTFATTWSEIDVSCEACHGPGSTHVAWARAEATGRSGPGGGSEGLAVDLRGDGGVWIADPGSPTARRSTPRASHAEIEMCARCHSRRGALVDGAAPGGPLLDSHRVSLLDEGLYFADGQIEDEVYVYGSFLQSRMFGAGVTCTDCHDPHTARVVASGNALCAKCHQPAVFDTPAHHHHAGGPGTAGTNCVDCHMPVRTYMLVDDRRDHSFRVPRPDLSDRLGTPNACQACHGDQSPAWAAERVAEWFGPERRSEWRFGEALHAGREGLAGAGALLERLIADGTQPAIARASGLELLQPWPGSELDEAVRSGAADAEGLVRMAAADAAMGLDPGERFAAIGSLLADPLLGVRVAAARSLASSVDGSTPGAARSAFERAAAEYVASELANAERAAPHVNLGGFYTDRGMIAEAEQEYRTAMRLEPWFSPAAVNLADLERAQGRDDRAETVLREFLKRSPRDAAARHALGLTFGAPRASRGSPGGAPTGGGV